MMHCQSNFFRHVFHRGALGALASALLMAGPARADDVGVVNLVEGVITIFGGNRAAAANAEEVPEDAVTQMATRLRPMLLGELDLLRETCELNKEARVKIKAAGEAGLKEAAKKALDVKPGGPIMIINGLRMNNDDVGPRNIIHQHILGAIKESLSAQQQAKYQEEVESRANQRKRSIIMCVVAQLDRMLFLTAEQREKIAAAILANWQEPWERWSAFQNNAHQSYFPQVPDNLVVPHLNDSQRKVWSSVQKVNFGHHINMNWNGANVQDDGWWEK
jgi:hypothetical protein